MCTEINSSQCDRTYFILDNRFNTPTTGPIHTSFYRAKILCKNCLQMCRKCNYSYIVFLIGVAIHKQTYRIRCLLSNKKKRFSINDSCLGRSARFTVTVSHHACNECLFVHVAQTQPVYGDTQKIFPLKCVVNSQTSYNVERSE